MKLVLTVLLGIFASFAFTVFFELLLIGTSTSLNVLHIYPQFPAITVSVGILVGLIERNKASITGVLSLAPWTVFMILGVNRNHSSASRWLITIAVVAGYSAMGIGAAILTAKTVRRVTQLKVSA